MRGVDIPAVAEGVLADFERPAPSAWLERGSPGPDTRLVGRRESAGGAASGLHSRLRAQEAGSVCLPLDDVMQTTFAVEPDQDGTPAQLAPPGEPSWPEVDEWSVRLAALTLGGSW